MCFSSCVVLANDTVFGEPLYGVPLNLDEEELEILPREARSRTPHLCFEIQGQVNTHFNILSDICTSANALYTALESSPRLNAVTRIGVTAINSNDECIFIDTGIQNDCVPAVTSANRTLSLEDGIRYNSNGVSVSKRRNNVRISVPNCASTRLVMYLTCIEREGGSGSFSMIRFDVTRGVNLSPTSHGILGKLKGTGGGRGEGRARRKVGGGARGAPKGLIAPPSLSCAHW